MSPPSSPLVFTRVLCVFEVTAREGRLGGLRALFRRGSFRLLAWHRPPVCACVHEVLCMCVFFCV